MRYFSFEKNENRHVRDAETPATGKLVVVDDDELYSGALEAYFSNQGFDIAGFRSGTEFLSHVMNPDPVDLAEPTDPVDLAEPADLLLLDWAISDLNGLDVLKRIREVGLETPVIFLTEYTDPVFEETALLVGAVDFVNKSRGFSILHRRVRLVLNGAKFSSGQNLPFEAAGPVGKPSDKSGLCFDASMGRVHWRGARVRLSASEVKVVNHLIENTDKFVGHREIYDLIRGNGFLAGTGPDGYRANVRAFLKRVRQKFRDVNPEFDEIENYPGLGYRWCGEVMVVDVDDVDPDPGPCRPEPMEAPCAPG